MSCCPPLRVTRAFAPQKTGCVDPRPYAADCFASEPGVPIVPCGEMTSAGFSFFKRTRHELGASGGMVVVEYFLGTDGDRIEVLYKGVVVATTGGFVTGDGALSWAYAPGPGDPTWCQVEVASLPTLGGDWPTWQYIVWCPE